MTQGKIEVNADFEGFEFGDPVRARTPRRKVDDWLDAWLHIWIRYGSAVKVDGKIWPDRFLPKDGDRRRGLYRLASL
jgi:hypothetical protein